MTTGLAPGDDMIAYAFMGGGQSMVSAGIATMTNSPLTHVGVKIRLKRPLNFIYKDKHVVEIPAGLWLMHASREAYPTSVGPKDSGVIITPLADVYRKYPKIHLVYHRNLDQTPAELREALRSFLEGHYGDSYGLFQLLYPTTVILGRQPSNKPVCSTLVVQWLFENKWWDHPAFETPRGLYDEMVRAGAPFVGASESPTMPTDSVALGVFVVFVALVIGLLSSWRRVAK